MSSSVELYVNEKNHAFDEAGNERISPLILVTAKNAIIDDTTTTVISSFNLTDGMTVSRKQIIQ